MQAIEIGHYVQICGTDPACFLGRVIDLVDNGDWYELTLLADDKARELYDDDTHGEAAEAYAGWPSIVHVSAEHVAQV
jgi:hypothetical protein